MPMTLTLSLSKKLTENFNSTGLSVTIGAEVDHSLLAEPAALQGRIDRLFAECDLAIERKLAAMSGGAAPTSLVGAAEALTKATTPGVPMAASQPQLGHAQGGNLGNGQAKPSHSRGRPATESQLRALRSIARRLGIDLQQEAYHEFAVASPEDLSITAASQLIDALKERAEAAAARGRGR
jgi:hypothetical protein